METLGQRLRAVRRRRVMTQAELAQAARVALITVTRLESEAGTGGPRPATVRRLARALDVDAAWLLFGDDAGGLPPPRQDLDGNAMPHPGRLE